MKQTTCLLAFLFLFGVKGQNPQLDSLYHELANAKHDTSKVLLLLKIGFSYYQTSPDSMKLYTNEGLALARAIDFQKGIASAHNNLGTLAYSESKFEKSIEYFTTYLTISEQQNDKRGVNRSLNNIGIIYKVMGNYPKALEFYHRSLEVKQEIGDEEGKAGTLNNIGGVYKEIGDYAKSLDYQLMALAIKEEIGKEESLASTYSNIGQVYAKMDQNEKAMGCYEKGLRIFKKYGRDRRIGTLLHDIGNLHVVNGELDKAQTSFTRSLEIANKLNDRLLIAYLQNDLGALMIQTEDYEEAIHSFNMALAAFQAIGNKLGEVQAMNLLAEVYFKTRSYDQAKQLSKTALGLAQELQLIEESKDATYLLHKIYELESDYPVAYRYAIRYNQISDTLSENTISREIELLQARFDLEMENMTLTNKNELNQLELEKSRLRIQRQNTLIYGGLALLVTLFGLGYLGLRYIRDKKKTIELLESKNDEIERQKLELSKHSEALLEAHEKVTQINNSLEETIKIRTSKIQAQNEKLKEYAFSNAHLVRAPLARIMGLAEFLKNERKITPEQKRELNENMLDAAEELDQVIRKVSEVLGHEEIT